MKKYLECPKCKLKNDVIEATCLRCGESLANVIPGELGINPGLQKAKSDAPPVPQAIPAETAKPILPTDVQLQMNQIAKDVTSNAGCFEPQVNSIDKYPYAVFFINYLVSSAKFSYMISLLLHVVFIFILGGAAISTGAPAAIKLLMLFLVALFSVLGFFSIRFMYLLARALPDLLDAFLQIERNTAIAKHN